MSSLRNRTATRNGSKIARTARTISRPTNRTTSRLVKALKQNSSDISMTEEPYDQTMKPVAYRKRSRRDPNYNFKRYLARLLRKLNSSSTEPNLTISSKAMVCMSNFMSDIFIKIAKEAGQLVKYNKTKTLSDWDIKSALKILMPGDLGKHALVIGYNKWQNMTNDRTVEDSAVNRKKMVFDPETGCMCPR